MGGFRPDYDFLHLLHERLNAGKYCSPVQRFEPLREIIAKLNRKIRKIRKIHERLRVFLPLRLKQVHQKPEIVGFGINDASKRHQLLRAFSTACWA